MRIHLLIFFHIFACFFLSAHDLVKPPEGWTQKGETLEFPGSSLYRHINGGAELYHRHGFENLKVIDFTRGELEIRLEIYQMKEATGSEAVFDEMTTGMKRESKYGKASVLDPYQIMFFRGQNLITVTRFELSRESGTAMEKVADDVDQSLIKQLSE